MNLMQATEQLPDITYIVEYRECGISEVRLKIEVDQGSLFIEQEKTKLVLEELGHAIHGVLEKFKRATPAAVAIGPAGIEITKRH